MRTFLCPLVVGGICSLVTRTSTAADPTPYTESVPGTTIAFDMDPADVAFDALVDDRLDVSVVVDCMTPEDVRTIAAVPWIGWRGTFVIAGALGFIWLIFWLALYEAPEIGINCIQRILALLICQRDIST